MNLERSNPMTPYFYTASLALTGATLLLLQLTLFSLLLAVICFVVAAVIWLFAFLGFAKKLMTPIGLVVSGFGLAAPVILYVLSGEVFSLLSFGRPNWIIAFLGFLPYLFLFFMNLLMALNAFSANVRDYGRDFMGKPWFIDEFWAAIWRNRVSFIFGLSFAALSVFCMFFVMTVYADLAQRGEADYASPGLELLSYDSSQRGRALFTIMLFGFLGFISAVISILCVVLRSGIILNFIRIGIWLSYAVYGLYLWLCFTLITQLRGIHVAAETPQSEFIADLFFQFMTLVLAPSIAVIILFFLQKYSQRSFVIQHHTARPIKRPQSGDVFYEGLRTHGRDPRFRKSNYGSVFLHSTVIFGPIIWQMMGCGQGCDAYEVLAGKGEPQMQQMQVKVVEEVKEYILNPNSPIDFNIPEKPDELLEKVNEVSEREHSAADGSGLTNSMLGSGGPGDGGFEGQGASVRFIRLKANVAGWDDGFGPSKGNMDRNFLLAYKQMTSHEVELKQEKAITPTQIFSRFKKGKRPPFLFFTGDGRIRMNNKEKEAIKRWTIEEGGMLFADAGSRQFHGSFVALMREIYGNGQLVNIPLDDPIFANPNRMPKGPPPLYAHGNGGRAMGVKHKGRWVVFYHPGDMGDSWEDGRSGMRADLADQAMRMGVNVLYYATVKYMAINAKYHKK